MIKSIHSFTLLMLCVFTFANCNNLVAQKKINSVMIGKQIWMTENLNVDRFRNGDLIPEAKTYEEWEKAGSEERPAWCYYKNDSQNGKKYGKLYNWYAVGDARGLAPLGWRIPSLDEFDLLDSAVNRNSRALMSITKMKGDSANTSGFSALFAGRRAEGYDFRRIGEVASFWTSNGKNSLNAWRMYFVDGKNVVAYNSNSKETGESVRCISGDNNISINKHIYKASLDTTFASGSDIILNNITDKDHLTLTVLGKLWGYLKYYYPTLAKGDINWDYELFRIMPKVLKSNSKEERNKFLSEWITSLGRITEKQEPSKIDESKVKFMPDLKWTEDEKELGEDVTAQLKEIKMAKRDTINYYFDFWRRGGNAVFENESAYKKMKYPDAGFRLLALYRFWNIIQYLYPYRNLIEDDWNKVLYDFIPEFIKAGNALEYRFTILRLIDKIHDSHASIWGNDKVLSKYFGNYIVPCKISFIENKAVVTEIYSVADSTMQIRVGDVIEKIMNEDIDKIVARKLPIYPASNYPTKLRNISYDILRSSNDLVSITYLRNGKLITENVKCVPFTTVLNNPSKAVNKSWKIIDNNTGYLFPGTIQNSELPDMMKNFQKCKGIIIDFRCYPSDFTVFTLSEYLMPAPIQFVEFSRANSEMPGRFLFRDYLSVGKNNPDYYKGRVVIIVNEETQSSAEYHVMAFKRAPKAIVIGSTTAGADGNVCAFPLPGGISTMITGMGVYYPDGGETQRIGIVPNIIVKPTIKGIIDGKDEVLDKAIQIIKDDKE